MSSSPWDRRIERAEELAAAIPAAAELLRFYLEVARFQRSVAQAALPSMALDSPELERALRPHYERLVCLMQRIAPPEAAGDEAFLHHLTVQPYAEQQARSAATSRTAVQPLCPYCGENPVAAVLRPEGEGGKRFLLCSLCATEWEFRRLLCPRCGEEDPVKLPVFTAEQFPHVRVEACESCLTYMKAVDLTRNGMAVPEVDELAAVALDLWAREQGYTKLQINVIGM
ncbi:MAG: formate dehydrogenase accessory protein FdhE [Candidatus Sulfopaludibacter sp.]|nr:formate dehydrogenase accessory protein FdhE [Candidatus Sulfopaludibacter sp.]